MAVNFYLLDNAGFFTEFDDAFNVTAWTAEDGTVTHTHNQDTVNQPTHPKCMKVVSTTDGKGVYQDVASLTPDEVHVVEFDYKIDATQEIDWRIWDQTNGANIANGTLDVTANWLGFYREVTTPANCTTIRLFLRAGTATSVAFYIDNIGCRGNVIKEDAESEGYERSLTRQSNTHTTERGVIVEDSSLSRMMFPLTWPFLDNTQFASLIKFARTRNQSYFNDGNMPRLIIKQQVFTETQYTYSGITNPSGTHVAYIDTDVDLPNVEGDFQTTEFSTANYVAVDGNDSNSVDTSITTTSNVKKYIYHHFVIDISAEYGVIDAIQRFKIKYVGEGDDLSDNDVNGVVVYIWNGSNWMRIGESTSKDKTTIDYSTDEPVQAQDFIDIGDQTVAILVRSRGHKGSGGNLTLKSYYISVWINQDMSSGVKLLSETRLDSGGDVVEVKNITDDNVLILGTDYEIGDGLDNIKAMSEDAGDLIEVTYNPRMKVTQSASLSDQWLGTGTPTTPPRSARLSLQSTDVLTEE
ncbi:hypothetical protein LCGC14_0853280 [marine sediment metagenome]|uniref:Uncharacterized protein n=1 Tax=marine sediment metagenome TaxID=412755 RepID=A0A0F9RU53_9ZZZZ